MTDEAKTGGKLKRAVSSAAPKIAEALGGPLAGAAVAALSRAIFGAEGASEDALGEALEKASPEQLVALAKAEHDFAAALIGLAVEEAR
ncbi:MAG: hypothetical protein AB7P23_08580, partial [Amphiplicatus sp.]